MNNVDLSHQVGQQWEKKAINIEMFELIEGSSTSC